MAVGTKAVSWKEVRIEPPARTRDDVQDPPSFVAKVKRLAELGVHGVVPTESESESANSEGSKHSSNSQPTVQEAERYCPQHRVCDLLPGSRHVLVAICPLCLLVGDLLRQLFWTENQQR